MGLFNTCGRYSRPDTVNVLPVVSACARALELETPILTDYYACKDDMIMAPGSPHWHVRSALRKCARTPSLSNKRSINSRDKTDSPANCLRLPVVPNPAALVRLTAWRHLPERIISNPPCRLTAKHSPGALCIAARGLRDFTARQTSIFSHRSAPLLYCFAISPSFAFAGRVK